MKWESWTSSPLQSHGEISRAAASVLCQASKDSAPEDRSLPRSGWCSDFFSQSGMLQVNRMLGVEDDRQWERERGPVSDLVGQGWLSFSLGPSDDGSCAPLPSSCSPSFILPQFPLHRKVVVISWGWFKETQLQGCWPSGLLFFFRLLDLAPSHPNPQCFLTPHSLQGIEAARMTSGVLPLAPFLCDTTQSLIGGSHGDRNHCGICRRGSGLSFHGCMGKTRPCGSWVFSAPEAFIPPELGKQAWPDALQACWATAKQGLMSQQGG